MIKFIIGGLPRSGTTWLSVFLTTDDCVCLHDPSATMTKEQLESWTGGICDTGIWFYEDWCKANTDKFIIVDRAIKEVQEAVERLGKPTLPAWITERFLYTSPNQRYFFEDLFTEELAEEIWNYVYPDKSFNRDRWNHLKSIYMSPIELEVGK